MTVLGNLSRAFKYGLSDSVLQEDIKISNFKQNIEYLSRKYSAEKGVIDMIQMVLDYIARSPWDDFVRIEPSYSFADYSVSNQIDNVPLKIDEAYEQWFVKSDAEWFSSGGYQILIFVLNAQREFKYRDLMETFFLYKDVNEKYQKLWMDFRNRSFHFDLTKVQAISAKYSDKRYNELRNDRLYLMISMTAAGIFPDFFFE